MPDRYFKEWLEAVRKSRRILLVDDNPNDCFIIVDQSKAFCLDWVVAHNYHEAVEEFKRHGSFRLVVLDLDLRSYPQGIDLYRWIKQNHPQVAVMVFSGHISEQVIKDIHNEGFAFFTPKPNCHDAEFFRQMFQALAIPLPLPLPMTEQPTKTETDTSEITI